MNEIEILTHKILNTPFCIASKNHFSHIMEKTVDIFQKIIYNRI